MVDEIKGRLGPGAIVIDNGLLGVSPTEYTHCHASQMMFHVGSLAALTLLINGILSGPILSYLEMTKTPDAKVALLENVRSRVAAAAAETYAKLEANAAFAHHDHDEVHKHCRILQYHKDKHAAGADEEEANRTVCDEQMLINVREVFMCVVRADYWEQIEHHELPHDSDAALSLITSTDIAMDHVKEKLNDWVYLKETCVPPAGLVKFMRSGKIIKLDLEGEDAVRRWRELLGPTNSDVARQEKPASVRARYGKDVQRNCAHGSDSLKSAVRELELMFGSAS